MFTGLVDHCGIVTQIEFTPDSKRIWISSNFEHLQQGESIAVDGICLTIRDIKDGLFSCDVSSETLAVTAAMGFKINQKVNLERALELGTRFGGHIVTGHIDQVSTLSSLRQEGEFIEMEFKHVDKKYLIPKGSVTVNGVSLTINALTEYGFNVMLIPHTLERTNLKELRSGDKVNIEFDMIVKTVVEQCQRYLHPLNAL